jgi:hypothetical protein
MKKLLLFPLLVITCFCFAQDAKEIIGKPVTIGNLVVAQNDFPNSMTWDNAKKACAKLGNGWRLPTKNELNTLYQNKNAIGYYSDMNYYWSSSVDYYNYFVDIQFFLTGFQGFASKSRDCRVRAVRSL